MLCVSHQYEICGVVTVDTGQTPAPGAIASDRDMIN
jgi:hypothetical protein